MRPALYTALPLLAALAAPASAQEMTQAERDAFRAEVRAYLLDNPEVIMEAIDVLRLREAQAAASADEALVAGHAEALFNDPSSFVGGNPEGDVTLVEFMDYRCGYCKRAFPEVADLLTGDGNIRYIIKEYPILGEQSVMAAQFALAVRELHGDEAYETVHNTLMTFGGDITIDSLGRLAGELGLDMAALQTAMAGESVNAVIAANRQLGNQLGISGTPTFVVESQMVRGYVPLDQMQQIVAATRG